MEWRRSDARLRDPCSASRRSVSDRRRDPGRGAGHPSTRVARGTPCLPRAPIIVTDWLAPWPAVSAVPYEPRLRNAGRVHSRQPTLRLGPRRARLVAAAGTSALRRRACRPGNGSDACCHRRLGRHPRLGHASALPIRSVRRTRRPEERAGDRLPARTGAHNATGSPYFQNAVVDSVIHAPEARAP